MKYQVYNKKIGAWVLMNNTSGSNVITNVKQNVPKTKFKGIKVKR